MDVLQKLAIKNLKLNIKITIFTIIGIMLFTATITTVMLMYSNIIKASIKYETSKKENYHVYFKNIPIEKINSLKNNKKIDDVFIIKEDYLEKSRIVDNSENLDSYCNINAYTNHSLNNLLVNIKEGRLPKNNNEILISSNFIYSNSIYKLGDNISFDYDSFEYDNTEDCNTWVTKTKTFKIVGIIDGRAYDFITYLDDNNLNGNYDVYVRYNKEGLKNIYKNIAEFKSISEKELKKEINEKKYSIGPLPLYENIFLDNIKLNKYLIDLETNSFKNYIFNYGINSIGRIRNDNYNTNIDFASYILIIFFISIIFIKNNSNILMYKKTKQYGMLRSIGTTKKQINKIIFYEALILGLISVPLGILLGIRISKILLNICNYFLASSFLMNNVFEFSFSYMVIAISIIITILTLYFSVVIATKKTNKLTSMELIKEKFKIKLKKNNNFKKHNINILGTSRKLAKNNIKRNKNQYKSITMSLIILVILINLFNKEKIYNDEIYRQMYNISDYNLTLKFYDVSNLINKLDKITNLNNIDDYSIVKESNLCIDCSYLTEEYCSKVDYFYCKNYPIYSIGSKQYEKYISELGLDYNTIKNKAILIDNKYIETFSDDGVKKIKELNFNNGDFIEGTIEDGDKKFTIEVGVVTEKNPLGTNVSETSIIISDEVFDKYFTSKYIEMYFKTNNAIKLQSDIQEILKNDNYIIDYVIKNNETLDKIEIIDKLFIYTFISAIILILIINIINIMTLNAEIRQQEFAILKSIGMTKKEIKRMIIFEGMLIGIKTIILGTVSSIIIYILSYLFLTETNLLDVFSYMKEDFFNLLLFPFEFKKFVETIILVFLIINLYIGFTSKKISKQNIIETIRNENI